jgi:hypothetical protein
MENSNEKVVPVNCKNCNAELTDQYCARCGQKADIRRITWGQILHFIPHALFHVNRGFVFTMKELFIRPGYTVKEYIDGKRVSFSNPIMYIVLLGGFTTLFYNYFDVPLNVEGENIHQMLRTNNIVSNKYFIIKTFAIIPLIAGICYFMFREFRLNFPEYIVMGAFLTGQMMLIILMFFPLSLATKNLSVHFLVRGLNLLAFAVFTAVFLYQFFNAKQQKVLVVKVVSATILMMSVFLALSKYLQLMILK